jgi:hypothetical protein
LRGQGDLGDLPPGCRGRRVGLHVAGCKIGCVRRSAGSTGEQPPVRSPQLETALTQFVKEAARQLQAELDAGAEVPFELAATAVRGRPALYSYRPLPGAFIGERWPALTGLESYAAAERLLECLQGLERYLLVRDVRIGRGARRARATVVARTLLEAVFAEQTDFELDGERLRRALEELDEAAFTNAGEAALIETLHGLGTVAPELAGARAPAIGRPELAWALARFEMGCERASELEALSDHLLALRALLEPEGPSSGRLAGRLAALCATPAERPGLTRRVHQALALERAVITGAALEHASCEALVAELTGHLRALLRDVVCGHLPPDLVTLADALAASPEEETGEVTVRRGAGGALREETEEVTARRGSGRLSGEETEEVTARNGPRHSPRERISQEGLVCEQASGEQNVGDSSETCEILNVPV